MFKQGFSIVLGFIWSSAIFAATSVPYDHAEKQLFKNPYGIVSLRLQEEQMQEHMAHPSVCIRTINVDVKEQRILSFSDFFSDEEKALQIIMNYSRDYFMKKLSQEKLPEEEFLSRADFIKMGTEPTLKNYQHWNLISGYLQITFDRAQVAPSYFGVQKVNVPLLLLTDVLNPTLFPAKY